jgi:hypothetical protein
VSAIRVQVMPPLAGLAHSFKSDDDTAHVGSFPDHVAVFIELARDFNSWQTNGSQHKDAVFV